MVFFSFIYQTNTFSFFFNIVETAATWLSNLNKDTVLSIIDKQPTTHESYPTQSHPDENIYLGWKLFKGADRPDLGLKDEKPRLINVKHIAQTYVVGIPEEYADDRSKSKRIIKIRRNI